MSPEYEFWEEEKQYYSKFFTRMNQKDLHNIWKIIASIAQHAGEKISWLDIGTGDGSLLKNIVNQLNKTEVSLTVVEPSKGAKKEIKENLSKHVTEIKIRGEAFDEKTKLHKKYDVITLMHANYYFEPKKYKEILDNLVRSLTKEGVLVILTISEEGDFQRLGEFPYDKRLLAENTYLLLQEYSSKIIKCDARFDAREYIKKGDKKEIFHYMRFLHQDNSIKYTEEKVQEFIDKIKKVAKNGILNYKDCIIIVNASSG